MSRARDDLSRFFRAGAAWAALAFLIAGGPTGAGQEAQPGAREAEGAGETVVGGVLIPAGASGPGGHLVPLLGRAVAWGAGGHSAAWAGFGGEVASRGADGPDGAWSLVMSDGGLRAAAREGGVAPEAQLVAFDISLDCNGFRAGSAQPFSRTARGRALDALTIDNARRARLTGLYADPDDRSVMSVVLFTESRAEAPGRWHALPLAAVTMAQTRGDATPPLPVLIEFGEAWGGVVFAAADLALALDPGSGTISSVERFDAWGMVRTTALRQLASGLDGRVWAWPGQAEGSVVCALGLSRGSTDRRVADALRTVFGQRLRWAREDSGRVTATLTLGGEGGEGGEGTRALSLRFITIADRTMLTVATDAADLDRSAETLADIAR
ncbi:MAG: hypothetical protein IT431_05440 [Phycisphaerales bacterium]|nr:hypothetical protein [Phycisphaerales bacterium]